MKKFLCALTGLVICGAASAQVPAKNVGTVIKALGRGAEKSIPAAGRVSAAGLRYAPGLRVSGAAVSVPSVSAVRAPLVKGSRVESAVLSQVQKQVSVMLPAESVREQVAKGASSPALVRSIFAVPPAAGRTALLQNEFLTLTLERGVPVTEWQAAAALKTYRVDLLQKKDAFKELAAFSSVKQLAAAKPQAAVRAMGALADVSGIGFYGAAEDAPVLLSVYEAAADTVLEPVAFTAVSRALLSLKAYDAFEKLLASAKPTEALEQTVLFARAGGVPVSVPAPERAEAVSDVAVLENLVRRVCVLNVRHLDFSADAARDWLALAARRTASGVRPGQTAAVPVNPIEVKAAPSLQVEGPAAMQAEENASLSAGGPAVPSARSYSFFARTEPASASSGTLYSGLPVMEWGRRIKKWFAAKPAESVVQAPAEGYNPVVPVLERTPRTGLVSKQYPSGLKDEDSIIRDWLEYFKNGYFRPRDQVEAIEGMSAAKANNVMEYLYYMSMEEAEKVILNPIRETGRLPDFMYDARLIAGTRRLPAGYYKNKFNENVKRFVELAEEDGSIFTHNVELKDLATTMADYSFEQGFRYTNDSRMTAGLRHNWRELVAEIRRPGLKAERKRVNELWRKPVPLDGGKSVSLKEYFTQKRPTVFFKEGSTPEFFLNSKKWVAWENERRNLAAVEFVNKTASPRASWLDRLQNWLVLGKPSNYLTVKQFADVMVSQYRQSFGSAVRMNGAEYAGAPLSQLEDATPSSLTVKINNFDKVGGVCQMSFTDGGFMGQVKPGYDGTSTVSRFEPMSFSNVRVVTFDLETLAPRVLTLKSVPYLKDLKAPDLDQVRAGTMVGDGLDPTRDLLSVRQAEAALTKVPHLKATLYPHSRLVGYTEMPEYLNGGGLGGYLALFTPDFYPLKTIYRLRFNGWRPYLKPHYFIRKEVPALAGPIHRDRLTFTEQVQDRAVDAPQPSAPESK